MSKAVGERLSRERARLKLSREAFAELGGMKEQAQGRYERGERAPDSDYLESLEKSGVDVNYVITGKHVISDTKGGYKLQRYATANDALAPVLAVQSKLNLLFSAEQLKILLDYAYTHQVSEDDLVAFVEGAYAVTGVELPERQ